jgi:glucose-6-phosphate 1-epimerase
VFDGSKPIARRRAHLLPDLRGRARCSSTALHATRVWAVHRSCADVNPDYPEPCVTLRLADSAATRAMWAHAFEALLEVTLKRDTPAPGLPRAQRQRRRRGF